MNETMFFDLLMCFIEGIILVYFINHVLEFNGRKIVLMLSTAAYILVSWLLSEVNMLVKMILIILAFFALCQINYKGKIISKIGYVIHAFYVIIISDISISNVIALFQQTSIFNTIINSGYSKVIFSFVIKLFNLILFTISIFIFKKVTKESETFYWICFDIVSACYLTISMAFVLLFPVTVYDPGIMTVFFFLAVFFLITSYIILYFFARLCEFHQKTHDDHIIRIKNKALTDYIELQNSYVEETHKLRHDIKNTISTISFLMSNENYEELNEYLLSINNNSLLNENVRITGNKTIDAVLSIKLQECRLKDIQFKYEISPLFQCGIELNDIVIILYNILDNGIEALSSLQIPDRELYLKMYNYGENIVIYSNNKFQPENDKNRFFDTDKDDKDLHGYGVKIIKEKVAQYLGDCSFKIENDMFQITLVIPELH